MRNPMHGKDIGVEYPIMGVDEIEILTGNRDIGEKGKTYGSQKSRKSEQRNKMKGYIT